jgi:hypothetical protein
MILIQYFILSISVLFLVLITYFMLRIKFLFMNLLSLHINFQFCVYGLIPHFMLNVNFLLNTIFYIIYQFLFMINVIKLSLFFVWRKLPVSTKINLRVLRFPGSCIWGFLSFGIWHRVTGNRSPNFKGTPASIFNVLGVLEDDQGTAFFRNIPNRLSSDEASYPSRPDFSNQII